MNLLLLLVVNVCFVSGQYFNMSLDGSKVFRIEPKNKIQCDFLNTLKKFDVLDFWTGVNRKNVPVDIMVPQDFLEEFNRITKAAGLKVKVLIDDVGSVVKNEKKGNYKESGEMTWDRYYGLEDIHSWMDSLEDAYPDNVTVISAGFSYFGRDIKGLKISFGPGRRGVFIEGGIHAREWISPATVTYLINELLTSNDARFRRVAESFDWYIFPSTNPDGYHFTHHFYRLWRKTLTPHSVCPGADPNRNWDIHWGEQGTSKFPCSEVYGGPRPFSEKETTGLANMIQSVGSTLDVYLSFHSYSQLLIIPYGHSYDHLDNYDDLYEIGIKAADALSQRYGTQYKVGNGPEIIYLASGGSMDWAKDQFKIPIVYTYELRDTGENGFLLPAEQIIPNCEEVMDSIVAMFEAAADLNYFQLRKN